VSELIEVDLTPAMLELERNKDLDLSLIGASDVPVLMGASRWGSELELQQRILHGRDFQAMPAAFWGSVLEPKIIEAYARGRGMPYEKPGSIRNPKGRRWQRVSLDAISADGALILEAKCVSEQRWYDEFGGGTGIPDSVRLQVQAQMETVDVDEAIVLVSRWDQPGHLWESRVEPDPAAQRSILRRCEDWWVKHIENGEPCAPSEAPPVLPAGETKLEIADGSPLDELLRSYANLKAEEKMTAGLAEVTKQQLVGMLVEMGASGAKHPLGSIYTTKPSTKQEVVWEEVALAARGRFTDAEWGTIIEAATRTKSRSGFVGVRLK